MSHGTGHPPTTGVADPALALLAIPDRLSDVQRAGRVCVWGGESLTATAVRLGARETDGHTIFPSGCRSCTATAAMTALLQHAPDCAACVQHAPDCAIGMALIRLTRDGQW
jgi:hypothetical protein